MRFLDSIDHRRAGKRYGSRVVAGPSFLIRYGKSRQRMVVCECDCGDVSVIKLTRLHQGLALTCKACVLRAMAPKTHGLTKAPEYYVWSGMIQRCTNKKERAYRSYGARGISVCPEWRGSFQAFYEYIGPRPGPDYDLDRINGFGNYEPGNVQWLLRKENRRKISRPSSRSRHFVAPLCCP